LRIIIIVIGILQVLGGIGAYLIAKSAIHEILGSLSFGMGIMSIALGMAVGELAAIRRLTEAAAPRAGEL